MHADSRFAPSNINHNCGTGTIRHWTPTAVRFSLLCLWRTRDNDTYLMGETEYTPPPSLPPHDPLLRKCDTGEQPNGIKNLNIFVLFIMLLFFFFTTKQTLSLQRDAVGHSGN